MYYMYALSILMKSHPLDSSEISTHCDLCGVCNEVSQIPGSKCGLVSQSQTHIFVIVISWSLLNVLSI